MGQQFDDAITISFRKLMSLMYITTLFIDVIVCLLIKIIVDTMDLNSFFNVDITVYCFIFLQIHIHIIIICLGFLITSKFMTTVKSRPFASKKIETLSAYCPENTEGGTNEINVEDVNNEVVDAADLGPACTGHNKIRFTDAEMNEQDNLEVNEQDDLEVNEQDDLEVNDQNDAKMNVQNDGEMTEQNDLEMNEQNNVETNYINTNWIMESGDILNSGEIDFDSFMDTESHLDSEDTLVNWNIIDAWETMSEMKCEEETGNGILAGNNYSISQLQETGDTDNAMDNIINADDISSEEAKYASKINELNGISLDNDDSEGAPSDDSDVQASDALENVGIPDTDISDVRVHHEGGKSERVRCFGKFNKGVKPEMVNVQSNIGYQKTVKLMINEKLTNILRLMNRININNLGNQKGQDILRTLDLLVNIVNETTLPVGAEVDRLIDQMKQVQKNLAKERESTKMLNMKLDGEFKKQVDLEKQIAGEQKKNLVLASELEKKKFLIKNIKTKLRYEMDKKIDLKKQMHLEEQLNLEIEKKIKKMINTKIQNDMELQKSLEAQRILENQINQENQRSMGMQKKLDKCRRK